MSSKVQQLHCNTDKMKVQGIRGGPFSIGPFFLILKKVESESLSTFFILCLPVLRSITYLFFLKFLPKKVKIKRMNQRKKGKRKKERHKEKRKKEY